MGLIHIIGLSDTSNQTITEQSDAYQQGVTGSY
jgi:hypothetical protein